MKTEQSTATAVTPIKTSATQLFPKPEIPPNLDEMREDSLSDKRVSEQKENEELETSREQTSKEDKQYLEAKMRGALPVAEPGPVRSVARDGGEGGEVAIHFADAHGAGFCAGA